MAATLAWATHDGVDWLVLRGWCAEALVHWGSLSAGDLAKVVRVLPSEVLARDGGPGLLQPIPGRYLVQNGEIRFGPRFPFLAGTSYTMLVDDQAVLRITRPAVGGAASTVVVAVHPTAEVLPRNALRFYVHFSAAMSDGLAGRCVHLYRDDTGDRIEGAFSPMEPELWDPPRRRLTVLLDPARLKQGLAPHREAGYPLQEATAVVLVVERDFRDAAGRSLVVEHRQRYDVGPDVRRRVDPAHWVLDPPTPGGRRPLVVRFERPLDRALLERCLTVLDTAGEAVPGATEVAAGERSWSFVPDTPWLPGRHRLLVDPVLEDLAGNSVVRVFDRDLDRPEHEPVSAGLVATPFVVATT